MARTNVRVRRADADDAVELAHLIRSADTRTGVFSGRPLRDPGITHLTERFVEIINDGERELLVAVEIGADGDLDGEGAIVGMLSGRPDDIGAIDLTRVLHVTHLLVDPRHRRRGVGRALLASAVDLAERAGCEQVLATTATGSREANRYLARLGFAPLVVQRIAQISRLRRSLGMVEALDNPAALRRARLIRAHRSGLAS